MKALIDTNVLIDYMTQREPFFDDAKKIIGFCTDNKIKGYIAAHSITDSFYIMRKYPLELTRKLLSMMCSVMSVVGINDEKLNAAINDLNFDDIEDCLQSVCAQSCGAEYIITRNVNDFTGSKIPPITPTDFLIKLKTE